MELYHRENFNKFNFTFPLIRFTKFVRPACLWQSEYVNYTNGIATGFGLTEYAGDTSDKLLKVKQKIHKLLFQIFY